MPEHVVISGGSGLIGSALIDYLEAQGFGVRRLVRRVPLHEGEVQWQPGERLDPEILEGSRAVVSLNGASIAKLPWTAQYRKQILRSRVDSTRTLVEALNQLRDDPPAFISSSAVGFYGNAPGRILTESSLPGNTFLARVCVRWEQEARKAKGLRTVLLRTASVINRAALLKPLIPLTRMGVAGPLGKGTQIWPWISLEDEVRAIVHTIHHEIEGPVNLNGPIAASANDIGQSLARHLRRPFWLPVPSWALSTVLGKPAAQSLLLSDANVQPTVLNATGFTFTHATVDAAITSALT